MSCPVEASIYIELKLFKKTSSVATISSNCTLSKLSNFLLLPWTWCLLNLQYTAYTYTQRCFLIKRVLERTEWPKIRSERVCLSYTGVRKWRFWNTIPVCVLRNNFWNGILVHSNTKIPLPTQQIDAWVNNMYSTLLIPHWQHFGLINAYVAYNLIVLSINNKYSNSV
jgi:hypothetical protein